MPEKASPSPKCAQGGCQCIPICQDQMARVTSFLQTHTQSAKVEVLPKRIPPPKGQLWFCQACSTVRDAPGTHCSTRIILVDAKTIEKDKNGRIIGVTCAQDMKLYRKAPMGSLENWKASPNGG